MTYQNPRIKTIVENAIRKSNTMFNPSYNQHVEELSGLPSDRDSSDYSGTEKELLTEHE